MKFILRYSYIVFFVWYLVSCKHHQSFEKKLDINSNSLKKKYSDLLGVSEYDIKNEKLYLFINEWYGVKYKYGGHDKSGIDCSGLTARLYLVVYKKQIASTTKELVVGAKKIKISDLQEGDLVFFNTNGKSISHVGVYLQNHKFVHASSKKGVMISDLNEPYFKQTYVSSGRIR